MCCSGLGAGTKGAELGPFALRIAAEEKSYPYFAHFPVETLINDHSLYSLSDKFSADFVKQLVDFNERIANSAAQSVQENQKTIVISGDHSNAVGSISGLRKAHPNSKIGIIWIDAHADLHSPYSSPSQNIHGMPLGALCGLDNKEFGHSEPPQENLPEWERLKNIGGEAISPKIKPQDIVFIDIRDLEQPEWDLIHHYDIKYFTPEYRLANSIHKIIEDTFAYHADKDILYITFDVDSMDPSVSKGTGTPVNNGLSKAEAIELLQAFYGDQRTKMLEVTEINPLLDSKNQMAKEVADILNAVILDE